MSDMIWNGSYTLGNSQETQITAGTGIKVNTPAAGQIQISNDETVLFEVSGSTNGVSTCTLSESPFNFKYIEVYVSESSELDSQCNKIYILSDSIQRIHIHYNSGNNSSQLVSGKGTITSTKLTITDTIGYDAVFSSGSMTLTRNSASQLACIRRVVGINRISGGN